jgi:CheY-like chemotaxis protein
VLIADDHPTNRKVVELILAQAAVDLVSVEDGAQALAACRTQTFDLVLMDMQMPVMDGLTAVREIRLH